MSDQHEVKNHTASRRQEMVDGKKYTITTLPSEADMSDSYLRKKWADDGKRRVTVKDDSALVTKHALQFDQNSYEALQSAAENKEKNKTSWEKNVLSRVHSINDGNMR
jgi:hypothetical protein